MKRKRNVLLFGAGAVMDWNAPSTNIITKELLLSGFKTNDNKTTIIETFEPEEETGICSDRNAGWVENPSSFN